MHEPTWRFWTHVVAFAEIQVLGAVYKADLDAHR